MSCQTPATIETQATQTCLPVQGVPKDELVRFLVAASLGNQSKRFATVEKAVSAAHGLFPEASVDDLRTAARSAIGLAFAGK